MKLGYASLWILFTNIAALLSCARPVYEGPYIDIGSKHTIRFKRSTNESSSHLSNIRVDNNGLARHDLVQHRDHVHHKPKDQRLPASLRPRKTAKKHKHVHSIYPVVAALPFPRRTNKAIIGRHKTINKSGIPRDVVPAKRKVTRLPEEDVTTQTLPLVLVLVCVSFLLLIVSSALFTSIRRRWLRTKNDENDLNNNADLPKPGEKSVRVGKLSPASKATENSVSLVYPLPGQYAIGLVELLSTIPPSYEMYEYLQELCNEHD